MSKKKSRYYYIFNLSYVGARYFGWQKQSEHPSIHQAFNTALEKALYDTFSHEVEYKSLGASRTDARVNAFEQRVKVKLIGVELDCQKFSHKINELLPFDIKVENIIVVDKELAVIAHAMSKEYFYFFTHNKPKSPFLFPFVTYFDEENLDFDLMQEGTQLFLGSHNFKNYSYRPSNTNFVRTLKRCELKLDVEFDSHGLNISGHQLIIEGDGFLKQMIRIIMGTLIDLGRGQCSLEDIKESLQEDSTKRVGFITPPHGLYLNKIKYIDKYSFLN